MPAVKSLRLILFSLFFLVSLPAASHAEEKHDSHLHKAVSEERKSPDGPGVDERLGARIPLELTFRDETGRTVTLDDVVSGPTIILPVYYSCTNVCNYLQSGMAKTLPYVKGAPGKEFRVISISFNPEETPAQASRMKKMYLTAMNSPFPEDGWRFLTGDPLSVKLFTDSIGYRFKKEGKEFIHPVASIVVSGDGTVVRYLYGTSFLAKDLSLALLEARDGKIGKTIRKVVDYCFTFDPAGKTYVFNILKVSATAVILCTGIFLLFLLSGGRKRKPYEKGSK